MARVEPAGKTRVLYVEDDAYIRKATALFLRDRGFDVRATGSQADAFKLAAEHKPHVAIVDWQLDVDGKRRLLELVKPPKGRKEHLGDVLAVVKQVPDLSDIHRILLDKAREHKGKPLEGYYAQLAAKVPVLLGDGLDLAEQLLAEHRGLRVLLFSAFAPRSASQFMAHHGKRVAILDKHKIGDIHKQINLLAERR
ncbi:MAG: hypothetical protein AABW54_04640 [Candidatus Micrarchaeota archaeon]